MFALTELLGGEVVDAVGARYGRLSDLAVRLDVPYPVVTRIQVRRGAQDRWFVPWELVALVEPGRVVLGAERSRAEVSGGAKLHTDELLLGEHVLDTQIVDVTGKRMVRVGDVQLAEAEGVLELAGVEVGLSALLRRLGLRRLAHRRAIEVVDWRDLHLASGRGHALQLRTTAARVHRLSGDELAHLVARLPVARGAEVLRAVASHRAAGALGAAHPDFGGRLIGELDPREAAAIVDRMTDADAAAALRHTDADHAERLLSVIAPERARRLRVLAAEPKPAEEPRAARRRYRKILRARRRAPS